MQDLHNTSITIYVWVTSVHFNIDTLPSPYTSITTC